jgi:uncharacterized protein (DUF934 family)
MPRRDPALLKLLRRQIAGARRLYSRDGKACGGSLTGTDSLILQAGFDTLSVRYIRRDESHKAAKSWSVRFSTAEPEPEELYAWLATLK